MRPWQERPGSSAGGALPCTWKVSRRGPGAPVMVWPDNHTSSRRADLGKQRPAGRGEARRDHNWPRPPLTPPGYAARVRHRGYVRHAENKHPNKCVPSSVSCSLALPVSQDREHIDRNHGRADVAVPPLPARAALRDREEPKLAGSSKCRHDTKRTADKRTKVYLAKQNDFTLCTCRGRRSTVPPLAPHPHLPPPGLPG